MNTFISVITTIQSPTQSVRQLTKQLQLYYAPLLIVGDKKGPIRYDLPGTIFLSLEKQLNSSFQLAKRLPVGHYTRKNIGYLEAIRQGATCIYETDDDNAPLPSWAPREEIATAIPVNGTGWINTYRYFSEKRIWPRGFPLDAIMDSFLHGVGVEARAHSVSAPIQQGLANGSPDVDAIWRLVLDEPFCFEEKKSIYLPEGAWCPFNSQSTWWWPTAYPLLYLPSYCTFRMTDIWRSFIAQRCLWAMDKGIIFHAPEVQQDRNIHNLMKDFEDEIPGYQSNVQIVEVLEKIELTSGVEAAIANLLLCYEALVQHGFFPAKELDLVEAWIEDLHSQPINI